MLTAGGQWLRPIALGILDDHSRLCCHVQWYLSETAEDLVHGLSQAIQKRGLPRALLTDNGSAMVAEEVTEGLLRLGIVHERTLPYSPYQNGKQEAFWGTLEGRLMKMLDGVAELTLEFLNQATQAWVEIEYNRAVHRETSSSPVERFAQAPDVLRSSPSSESLRDAFRLETKRSQRQSDGTISLEGVRFEIPGRYRHFREVAVRYARWDLGRVDLVDQHSGAILAPIYPLDKSANADGRRASSSSPTARTCRLDDSRRKDGQLPPLLKKILEDYSATGMPPAYLPKTPPSQNGEYIMNSKKLLAQWGLKWNPFSPELPSDGLLATPKIEHFAWRVEQLVQEGGFALITGESGTGKSVALRIVAGRLRALRDVTVGVIERPQSKSPDFYRELGDIFAVKLTPHNRWGGFKALRERWKAHVASSRIRPVLLIDEAQEMSPDVLGELRILSSADFDATSLLTVVLSGDGRLLELLRHEDLVPLGTRIRTRLVTEAASREELLELLRHALEKAGNATLMTAELMDTLVDHSAGNYRLLMTMGAELLAYGMANDVAQLDEKCYLEVFQPRNARPALKKKVKV